LSPTHSHRAASPIGSGFVGAGACFGMAWILALWTAACATGAAVPGGGSPSSATLLTISPSAAPSAFYSSAAPARPAEDPFAAQVKSETDRAMKRLGRKVLEQDSRLDQVARDVARITAERDVPASSVVTFLLAHYGVVEPEPNLIVMRGARGSEASALADLRDQLERIPAASSWRRVGIGVWRSGDSWNVVIALEEHTLNLDPLPRVLPSRGRATVSGRALGVYRSPEVLVTSPTTGVHRLPTQVGGSTFEAVLECNSGDGVYQVEVSAEDQRGPTVLANFPVYCGVRPPATLKIAVGATPSTSDEAEIEKQILDLMDRDRRANGLPVLERDARLGRIARLYSREMAELGEVAHVSQRSGNAVDRVRAARIAPMPTVVAENVGRDYSAVEAERGFMSSPGHRDNILSRAVTHVGVGVALGKREGGNTPVFVTQIFAGWGQ
jgi:uncharacterized protein YkwD